MPKEEKRIVRSLTYI